MFLEHATLFFIVKRFICHVLLVLKWSLVAVEGEHVNRIRF